jgi:hypothetical protein
VSIKSDDPVVPAAMSGAVPVVTPKTPTLELSTAPAGEQRATQEAEPAGTATVSSTTQEPAGTATVSSATQEPAGHASLLSKLMRLPASLKERYTPTAVVNQNATPESVAPAASENSAGTH